MSSNPRFTVILPTHNRIGVVGRAIDSVLTQTDGDFELFVVDDGSKDDTARKLKESLLDPRVHILARENGGAARARNTALAEAKGDFVVFIDSDDVWTPHHLATRRRHLDRHRRTDFLAGGFDCIGSPLLPDKYDPSKLIDVRTLDAVCGTFCIRRELLAGVGGFPEVAYSEDGDLMVKLLADSRLSRRVREVTYLYDRTREDSISIRMQRAHQKPRERTRVSVAFSSPPSPPAPRLSELPPRASIIPRA